MATQIINMGGSPYGLHITPEGAAVVSGLLTAVVSGGIHIGSVTANVDTIYVQSGANMTGSSWVYQKTDPWIVSGTAYVEQNTSPWIISGNVMNSGLVTNFGEIGSDRTGSIAIVTNPVPISGKHLPGSVYQVTNPWITSGTSTIAGSAYVTGSINIATKLSEIGSYTSMVLGSSAVTNFAVLGSSRVIENVVGVTPSGTFDINISTDPVPISGVVSISGVVNIGSVTATVDSVYIQSGANMVGSSYVYQKTNPWVVSGTSTVAGSVYTTGSQRIVNFGDLGSQRVVEGSIYQIPVTPTLVSSNPAGSLTYAGDVVGSITAFIGASSYVKRLTYSGNVLVNIGSWV